MRRALFLFCCLAAALAPGGAAAAGEGEAEQNPTLEYRPPRPVLPEPKAPVPAPPVAIFKETLGGFGIGTGSFDRPVDVALDRANNLYVVDAGNSRVQKFDSFANFVGDWGGSGARPGEFSAPGAIVVDEAGFVYVADTGNHRVQKFDGAGKFIASWGSLGSRAGDFKSPADIAVDGDGMIWVLDAGNERVQRFDPTGRFLAEWGRFFGSRGGSFSSLVSLAWSDERFGYLYLLGEGCLVQQFEIGGSLVRSWSAAAPESGLCVPGRIESNDEDDYLYVLDAGNGLLARFTRDGRFMAAMRGAERAFSRPLGLAMNPGRGDFAVADTGNNIVQKFTLR